MFNSYVRIHFPVATLPPLAITSNHRVNLRAPASHYLPAPASGGIPAADSARPSSEESAASRGRRRLRAAVAARSRERRARRYIWAVVDPGILMGFNICNAALISSRCGNGGAVANRRADALVFTFVFTALASAYVLWQGGVGDAVSENAAAPLTTPRGIACLATGLWLFVASACMLVVLAREAARCTTSARMAQDAAVGASEEKAGEAVGEKAEPSDEALFRAPGVPWVPGAAIFLNGVLMAQHGRRRRNHSPTDDLLIAASTFHAPAAASQRLDQQVHAEAAPLPRRLLLSCVRVVLRFATRRGARRRRREGRRVGARRRLQGAESGLVQAVTPESGAARGDGVLFSVYN